MGAKVASVKSAGCAVATSPVAHRLRVVERPLHGPDTSLEEVTRYWGSFPPKNCL